MRRAPPVTSAAGGTAGVGKPPSSVSLSGAGTACLAAGAYLGTHHFAGRHAGAPRRRAAARPVLGLQRQPQFGLFEPADLVAQPGRLLEFEIGGGAAHALFQIGDDRLQILALVMRGVAFTKPDGDVVALVDTVEDVGDAMPHALRRDAVRGVVDQLLLTTAIGFF